MKNLLKITLLSLVVFLNFGCAHNYYNIPRESYEKKVRVLGVAPFFVDGDSDIRHPDREGLVALARDLNRKNEKELVARLKDTEAYLSVRMPDANADQLFSSIFFRRERRSDAGVVYNKYFFKQQEVRELIEKNSLDAVMLVVVSGLTRKDKLYSSNFLSFLEYDYNYLALTAQILDADGFILWEYPNFQQKLSPLAPLLNLQFADFDEATANVTEKVDVKFKTLPGITRAFAKPASSQIQKDAPVSRQYAAIFDEMVAMLKPPFRFPWEASRVEVRREPSESRIEPARFEPKIEPATVEPVRPEAARPKPAAVVADPAPVAPSGFQVETLTPEK